MSEPLESVPGLTSDAERLAREHLRIVADGDEKAAATSVTADFFNHRSADEPMSARQRGPFVVHDSLDALVIEVFPSTGRSFAVRQTHWITVSNGAVCEHDAVHDDLAMAKQLGWLPPRSLYFVRMLCARMQERAAQKAH